MRELRKCCWVASRSEGESFARHRLQNLGYSVFLRGGSFNKLQAGNARNQYVSNGVESPSLCLRTESYLLFLCLMRNTTVLSRHLPNPFLGRRATNRLHDVEENEGQSERKQDEKAFDSRYSVHYVLLRRSRDFSIVTLLRRFPRVGVSAFVSS